MKIIYIHQYFNTPSMSGGTRSYEMARRLVRAGHEVHVITTARSSDGEAVAHQTEEDGIIVHWVPVPYSHEMSYFRRIRSFFDFSIKAIAVGRKISAHLVFATSTPLTVAIPGVFLSKTKKAPMVFEVRDLWPEIPIALGAIKNPLLIYAAKKMELFAYKNARAVVALSPGMRDGVVKAGFDKNKVAVIPNSSDIELFDNPQVDARAWDFLDLADGKLIVYGGTFGKVNGVDYVVDVAAKLLLLDPSIKILLVGKGKEKPAVLKKAEEAGVLGVNLFVLDSVKKKEMPGLLALASLASSFVMDDERLFANSANKFFDALAAGRPIWINHVGWMADILEAHDCGLVTYRQDAETVARLLVEKLSDDTWLKGAGQRARDLALSQFSRDELASELERVLLWAAGVAHQTPFEITENKYK